MKEKPREFFYTAKPIEKQVTHDEFIQFIRTYPRRLYRDVYGVSDPPAVSYNDFALANRWPYSIVARTWMYDDDPDDYFYAPPENRRYYIVVNFDEPFKSKTGNEAGPNE